MEDGDANDSWTRDMEERRLLLPEPLSLPSGAVGDYYSYLLGDISLEEMLTSIERNSAPYGDESPQEDISDMLILLQTSLIIMIGALSFTLGVILSR